jgi:hypothetical protein
MKNHTLFKRAMSVALLSSTLALPAVVGLTAGTANAKPRCEILWEVAGETIDAYNSAVADGDQTLAQMYLLEFRKTKAEYKQLKCGQ